MTGMLGHPVAENPIDLMFDAVYAHYGLPWQFWKSDIATETDLALAVKALVPLGYRGMGITVPWKVGVMPLLDEVDDDVRAIGAANYLTVEEGRLIGHNNDGKGVVKAIGKVTPLAGQRVVMLGAGGAGRAMAVELAWAGAAHLTLITRREEQGREVAATVTRASGVPADWQPWSGEVA
ncbi:MAG: shikimate dehydrogenase family protein, partial [Synechococcaceae cyanobacterium]